MLLVSVCVGIGACGGGRDDSAAVTTAGASTRTATTSASEAAEIRRFGHAASAAEESAVATLVKHYYAAAASEHAAAACALIYPVFAETIVERYGHPPGPLYLRGAATCTAVLGIVFRHFHSRLTAPVEVTGVRVKGPRGMALLRFGQALEGMIEVRREGRGWTIDQVLAEPL